MIRIRSASFCYALLISVPLGAATASPPQPIQASPAQPSYATLAASVIGAPLIIDAQIRSASRIKGEEAAGLAPDRARFYIEADVNALIRGTGAMPARIGYVADVPLDARGRAPRLKKQRVLLFARAVPGRPDQVQLTAVGSQFNWSPDLDSRVRSIAREALAANPPPAITGVGNVFHVPGTLPGEGETQIFLQTETGTPVSLQVLRRPGEQTRWSVSLSDIVDESAGAPQADTLLWYRLACGLPRTLPPGSIESDDPRNAAIAREDYAFVLSQLGPCT